MAIQAVASHPLGEDAKKPAIEGAGVFLQSDPAPPKDEGSRLTFTPPTLEPWPLYQPGMLYPEDRTVGEWSAWSSNVRIPGGETGVLGKARLGDEGSSPARGPLPYPLPEHDPLTAYVLDPGFTIPKPAPPPSAPVQSAGGALTEADARAVLTAAGWPAELHDAALAVAWCESRWNPHAVGDGGASVGWFQLNRETWFRYAGEDANLWNDPLVNARTAWATYNYDLDRGYGPWKQWSCKP